MTETMEVDEAAPCALTGNGTVCVAGLVFEGREALWRHVVEVQQKVDEGVAAGVDAFFLFALLSCHLLHLLQLRLIFSSPCEVSLSHSFNLHLRLAKLVRSFLV